MLEVGCLSQGGELGKVIVTPVAITLVIAILSVPWLSWILSKRFFVVFGRISFAVYMVHFPLLASVGAFVFSETQSRFFATISFVVATFLAALVLERFVDRPGIALSKRLEGWLASKPTR